MVFWQSTCNAKVEKYTHAQAQAGKYLCSMLIKNIFWQ